MKLVKASIVLAALWAAPLAQAGSIACAGNHLGYQFGVSTRTQGDRVVGNVNVAISQGGRAVKRSTLSPTASEIREDQYIRFSATGPDGSGTLNANYAGGGYSGVLVAKTNWGTFNVNVNCRLSASTLDEDQLAD